ARRDRGRRPSVPPQRVVDHDARRSRHRRPRGRALDHGRRARGASRSAARASVVTRPEVSVEAIGAPEAEPPSAALLEVRELSVAFPTSRGLAVPVNSVSLTVRPGETLGIVGESGSGKSMTCRAIMGLIAWPGGIVGGSIRWRGTELVGRSERSLREIRG